MGEIAIATFQRAGGAAARVLKVSPDADASRVVEALAIPAPRAVLVLNGGTAPLEEPLRGQLERQIADGVARVAVEEGYTIVTGGTDAGVFALLGQGLGRWQASAPVIGVAVEALARWPGNPLGDADLEPHHSHFVLVRGRRWGAETALMYELIAALSTACPSIAIFAGGGEIVFTEMQANLDQRRKMILLSGSGRATDTVLAARAGTAAKNARVDPIAKSTLIRPFEMAEDPAALASSIRLLLSDDSRQ